MVAAVLSSGPGPYDCGVIVTQALTESQALQLRDLQEVLVAREQRQSVLEAEGRNPEVVRGDGSSLPTQLEVQLSVVVRRCFVSQKNACAAGLKKLAQ